MALLAWACSFAAVAHHPPAATLPAGVTPCVDGESIVLKDDAARASWGAVLAARLTREAETLLGSSGRDIRVRGSCRGEAGYVRVDLSARKLDPAVYLDADDASYGVRVDLRVGRHEALAGTTWSEATFHVFMADLHTEAEAGTSVQGRLLDEGRHAFLSLAAAHAAAPPNLRAVLARALNRPPILAPLLGLLFAAAVVFVLPPSLARSRRTVRAKGTQP